MRIGKDVRWWTSGKNGEEVIGRIEEIIAPLSAQDEAGMFIEGSAQFRALSEIMLSHGAY